MLQSLERREFSGVVYAIFSCLEHKNYHSGKQRQKDIFSDDGSFVGQDSRHESRKSVTDC